MWLGFSAIIFCIWGCVSFLGSFRLPFTIKILYEGNPLGKERTRFIKGTPGLVFEFPKGQEIRCCSILLSFQKRSK